MHIEFEKINPLYLKEIQNKYDVNPENIKLVYSTCFLRERKCDEFERRISSYLFKDQTSYLIDNNENIYKVISKYEASDKIDSEDIVCARKLSISLDDVKCNFNYDSYLFDFPLSNYNVKIRQVADTEYAKMIKYSYLAV